MADRSSGTLVLVGPIDAPAAPVDRGEACLILLHPPGPEIGRRTPLLRSHWRDAHTRGAHTRATLTRAIAGCPSGRA